MRRQTILCEHLKFNGKLSFCGDFLFVLIETLLPSAKFHLQTHAVTRMSSEKFPPQVLICAKSMIMRRFEHRINHSWSLSADTT